MRIAVSGTHGMGKSTLAEDFVEKHPEYVHLRDLMREVAKSIERLELIVFLPIVAQHKIMLGSDEDENFRIEVDHYFKQLCRDDIYGLFSGQRPEVVELWGSRKGRLARLESQLRSI